MYAMAVFILVAALAPLQSHGEEKPLDKDLDVLQQLIGHNKDLSNRLILAMKDILHRRQTSGCITGKINTFFFCTMVEYMTLPSTCEYRCMRRP